MSLLWVAVVILVFDVLDGVLIYERTKRMMP